MQSNKQENYMKTIRSLRNGLIVCGVALAMAATLSAQNVTQSKAKVVRIKGYARFSVGNNVWQPLKAGEILRAGTVIQTGVEKGSFVDLVLGDVDAPVSSASGGAAATPVISRSFYQPTAEQNTVRVWENSLLGIDKLTSMETGAGPVTETQLDLKAGRIFGNVKKMSAASRYEVKIPNGVAGIRGTIYDITAEGVIRVAAGSVVLSFVGADGNPVLQEVPAGQEFDARTLKMSPLPASEQDMMLKLPRGIIETEGPPTVNVVPDVLERLSPTTEK